ncbi:MAG: nucleotide exchange factor GrpE [Proteobacteria bacterium]|jgi:molecular chaperone GrpE|nr:nucleotide exchange factor GrpE [Pseudomonadota bacterium]MDA0928718.1 nucleotide exchange factor GrpE [Pseudomonadota bacterium]
MSEQPHPDDQDSGKSETSNQDDAVSSMADSGSGQAENSTSTDMDLEQALMKLAEAEQRADQARDDLLRVQAEMQNLRRRTQQDVEKAHKFGQEKFSAELLSVIDNLERALAAASAHEDESVKAIYEGVDLTLKSFMDCFSKFNIETVDPLGEPFDPALHQAMSIQENPDVEPNTVIAVMQKGYTLHGRVLRPAMVMVSKASGGGATGGNIDEQA